MNKYKISKKIVSIVKRSSRRLVTQKSDLEALSVCASISTEFYLFLKSNGSKNLKNSEEVDYINGTIRSGMDWFFGFLFASAYVENVNLKFSWESFSNYSQLRRKYIRCFDELLQPRIATPSKLQLLLKLIKYQIMFMGVSFDCDLAKRCQFSRLKFRKIEPVIQFSEEKKAILRKAILSKKIILPVFPHERI